MAAVRVLRSGGSQQLPSLSDSPLASPARDGSSLRPEAGLHLGSRLAAAAFSEQQGFGEQQGLYAAAASPSVSGMVADAARGREATNGRGSPTISPAGSSAGESRAFCLFLAT